MFWNCSVLVDEIYKWLVLSLVISTFSLHVIILPVEGFSLVIWPSVIDPLTQQWGRAVYSTAKTDMLTGNASFSLNCSFAGIIFSEIVLFESHHPYEESYRSRKKTVDFTLFDLLAPARCFSHSLPKNHRKGFACSLALWQCCGTVKVSESKIIVLLYYAVAKQGNTLFW